MQHGDASAPWGVHSGSKARNSHAHRVLAASSRLHSMHLTNILIQDQMSDLTSTSNLAGASAAAAAKSPSIQFARCHVHALHACAEHLDVQAASFRIVECKLEQTAEAAELACAAAAEARGGSPESRRRLVMSGAWV